MPVEYFTGNDPEKSLDITNKTALSLFAHEALHVWQRKHGKSVFWRALLPQVGRVFGRDSYAYDKKINDPVKVLKMFLEESVEGQGKMFEDYVLKELNGFDTSKFSLMAAYVFNDGSINHEVSHELGNE